MRLRRKADFDAVFRRSRKLGSPELTLYYAVWEDHPGRLGISASRKVGGAVIRNRVKRRIREYYRRNRKRLRPGHQVVVVARPAAASLEFAGFEAALEGLFERGGLFCE